MITPKDSLTSEQINQIADNLNREEKRKRIERMAEDIYVRVASHVILADFGFREEPHRNYSYSFIQQDLVDFAYGYAETFMEGPLERRR